jgi:hypothetical protein
MWSGAKFVVLVALAGLDGQLTEPPGSYLNMPNSMTPLYKTMDILAM